MVDAAVIVAEKNLSGNQSSLHFNLVSVMPASSASSSNITATPGTSLKEDMQRCVKGHRQNANYDSLITITNILSSKSFEIVIF